MSSLREQLMKNRWSTRRSKLKNPRLKSRIVIRECLSLCTPTQASSLSKPSRAVQLHTGTNKAMRLNGKLVTLRVYTCHPLDSYLQTVPTDEEIEKFYNDIKGAVAAHAAGATIVQEPVLVSAPEHPSDPAKRENPTSDEQQQQQKKKRKVEAPSVKKPTAQIEKWANKREELRGQQTATTGDGAAIELSEFADTVQMCCLLCKRKFQSVEEIQKHEKLSKLHKVPNSPFLGGETYD